MGRRRKIKTEEIKMSERVIQEIEVVDNVPAIAPQEDLPNYEAEIETIRSELDFKTKELEDVKRQVQELVAKANRPIDQQEQAIIEKQINTRTEGARLSDQKAKQKAYDNVKVTGRFMNMRAPGQSVKLPYIKYIDDDVKWHQFDHGRTYTIKRGFADQINEYYAKISYRQSSNPMDPNNPNQPAALDDTPTRESLYAFVGLSY